MGQVVFSTSNLRNLQQHGKIGPYIFLCNDMTPDDIGLLKHCNGVISSNISTISHAAVVCRAMALPAITDHRFQIDDANNVAYALGHEIHEGDFICITAVGEAGWSLSGEFVPLHKKQIEDDALVYLIDVMHYYDDLDVFSTCDIDFQLHYAKIKSAIGLVTKSL
jgi:phosphoenolpyruvate synthase/pyruvate phosphate dikinase